MWKLMRSTGVIAVGVAVVFLLLAGIEMPAAGFEKIQLGLHLKAGKTYQILFTTEQEILQTLPGQELKINQTLGLGYSFEVQEVAADGTTTCKATYSSGLFKLNSPQGTVEYDSTHPPEQIPAAAKAYAALVGRGFTIRFTSAGKVTDLQGIDELFAQIIKALEFPDEQTRATVEKQIRDQFGPDSIREQVERTLAIYPDHPVDIADSWDKRVTLSAGFPLIVATTYTLKDRKDGIAVLDVASKLSTNPEGKPMQAGPATMTFSLSGEQKGQMELEEGSGWTVGARLTQQMSGTVTMTGAGQDLSWPISIKGIIRIESK